MTVPIEGDGFILRNWAEFDRPLFHEINSDPQVMRFFPFTRNRAQSDELMERLAASIDATGLGFLAIQLKETGECAGFAGLAKTALEPVLPDGTVEIGWRLARRHWGKGIATSAAKRLLEHGFNHHGLDEIVSFAVHDNHRSLAVMQRVGMKADPSRDFEHPSVPEDFPHLKRHRFYALLRHDWQRQHARSHT